ncbi:hypothetical protein IMCC1989_925 [gamma proteobacterium IMCC1989]|nr:hypothetical protein IMCC1989_925 [gamma proteobacterium IMCC1989]
MQIIKSNRLGLIHKTYHLKHHRFAVGALAFFPLQGDSQHPVVEYDQWPKVMSQLPMGEALDIGFVKPRGEALVCAKGYFHQHGVFYRSTPRLEIESIKKQVRISRWNKSKGNALTDFMPVDVLDKRRSQYNGTYDKKWLEKVHPGLPVDTDTRLFNTAPKDQQLTSGLFKSPYFTAGSSYVLRDMHPTEKCIEGFLPDINVRIFTDLKRDPENQFVELKTNLETVWFFPEIALGVAIFRGETEVNDSDGLDVNALLLAYENTQDEPRTIDYYKNVLSLRTNMKTAIAHVFNESQLMPLKTPEETAAMEALIQQGEAEEQEQMQAMREQYLQQAQEIVDQSLPEGAPGNDELQQALTEKKQPSTPEKSEYDIPTIPSAVLAAGDFDLTDMLAATDQLQEKLQKEMAEKQAELEKLAGGYQDEFKDKYSTSKENVSSEKNVSDKTLPAETIDELKLRLLTPVYVVAEDLKQQQQAAAVKGIGDVIDGLSDAAKQQLNDADELDPNTLAQAYDKLLTMQRQARQCAQESMNKKYLSDVLQQQAKAWVIELITAKKSLAGRDFSNINLSGMNFSGLDCRDVMFENSNLNDCDFSQANLSGAVFTEALINNTCFAETVLTQANFSKASGVSAIFVNACLDRAVFTDSKFENTDFSYSKATSLIATTADFSGSDFCHATFDKSLFNNTSFEKSQWHQSSIVESIFMQSILHDSQWHEATLYKCIFVDAKAKRVSFHKSALELVQFSSEADLENADFSHASCKICGFRGVNLQKLKAHYAVFVECDFGDAKLQSADVSKAIFKRSLMTLAQLTNANCRDVLFNEAVVRKVNFDNSHLVESEFFNCTLESNSYQHSLLRRSVVKPQTALK